MTRFPLKLDNHTAASNLYNYHDLKLSQHTSTPNKDAKTLSSIST